MAAGMGIAEYTGFSAAPKHYDQPDLNPASHYDQFNAGTLTVLWLCISMLLTAFFPPSQPWTSR